MRTGARERLSGGVWSQAGIRVVPDCGLQEIAAVMLLCAPPHPKPGTTCFLARVRLGQIGGAWYCPSWVRNRLGGGGHVHKPTGTWGAAQAPPAIFSLKQVGVTWRRGYCPLFPWMETPVQSPLWSALQQYLLGVLGPRAE